MLVYTHIVIAIRVSKILGLDLHSSEAYMLGAILPDIRYPAGLPREQTHVSIEQFMTIARQCPASERKLLAGYLVHLIADEFALEKLDAIMFPLIPEAIRRHIKTGILNLMLEIGYKNQAFGAIGLLRDAGCLGGHLGLSEQQVTGMVERVERYLYNPTLEQAIKILGSTNLSSNRNIRFYLQMGRAMYQMKFIRQYITAKVARIMEGMEQELAHICMPWMKDVLK